MSQVSRFVKSIAFIIAVIIVSASLSYFVLAVWDEPNSAPPVCDPAVDVGCNAPINVGAATQTKTGDLFVQNTGNNALLKSNLLSIGGLAVINNLNLSTYGLLVPNGNVGIGTVNPIRKLHIVGEANEAAYVADEAGNSPTEAPDVFLRKSRGTVAAPLDVIVGDSLGGVSFFGRKGNVYSSVASSTINGIAESFNGNIVRSGIGFKTILPDGSDTDEKMRITADGNVGIGTIPAANSKLHVYSTTGGGTEITSEAVGNTKFADYHAKIGTVEWGFGAAGSAYGSNLNGKFYITDQNAVPGGITRMVIDSDGKVGIGTPTPDAKLTIFGNSDTDFNADNLFLQGMSNMPNNDPAFIGMRSRRTGIDTPASVLLNDTLLELIARGYDNGGSQFAEAVNIRMSVDGAVGLNKVPGRIDFRTSDINGVAGSRMIIKNDGKVGIGTTNPGSKLTVKDGDIYLPTSGTGVILKDTANGNCYKVTVTKGILNPPAAIGCPVN